MNKHNAGWIFATIALGVCLIVSIVLGLNGYFFSVAFSNQKTDLVVGESVVLGIKENQAQVVSFTLFNEAVGWTYWCAYLFSLILSIVWNFTFNRQFTFKSAANVPVAMAKVFAFYVVFTPLSTYLGNLAVTLGVFDWIVFALTLLSNFILEFLYCKFFVYKNSENTL